MSYALQTLWHERNRYASGVLAVTFSAVLIALQCGLMLGLFKITSIPIDNTTADLWVGSTAVPSVDLGKPIPESYMTRLSGIPGVGMPEYYIANFANFTKPSGGTELCYLLGSKLDTGAAGAATLLTKDQREALTMPFAIIVDESDVKRLESPRSGRRQAEDQRQGSHGGRHGEGTQEPGRAVGVLFAAHRAATARLSLAARPCDLLAGPLRLARAGQGGRGRTPRTVPDRHGRLHRRRVLDRVAVVLATRTKAGLAIGYAALLGLVVGMVITAQTLYSATAANAKEFAILLALGIPRWRISLMVLAQSFWVGVIGIALAYPICHGLRYAALRMGNDVDLRWEVLAGTTILTIGMALLAGVLALRSVRQIEPMTLLR